MRIAAIISVPVLLSGCVHLGAKPMTFHCGDLLTGNIETYQSTPLFVEIRRDSGADECPNGPDGKPDCPKTSPDKKLETKNAVRADDPIVDALQGWQARRSTLALHTLDGKPAPVDVPVLMLSGGGSWGAFGAGYLNQLRKIDARKDSKDHDWAVVTGVSTGALQGLFVAAGDYEALEINYRISNAGVLARKNGLLGMLSRGSENDISPLRERVMEYLLPANDETSPLLRMARPESPAYSIATVEALTGDLKTVHITQLVRKALAAKKPLPEIAECVAGVAIASSSIPVRLTPVRIDGKVYTDGGVRSSVFEDGIGERMTQFLEKAGPGVRPHLYVIRNGPTIVFRDVPSKDHPGVDARPDILRLGMRGYSTIVNQNELMSIASLRLNYPRGPISVISADGFNSPRPDPRDLPRRDGKEPFVPPACGPRPEELFHAGFMQCLANWGVFKAEFGPEFIRLSELEWRFVDPEPATR